jgi:hypothetical protein
MDETLGSRVDQGSRVAHRRLVYTRRTPGVFLRLSCRGGRARNLPWRQERAGSELLLEPRDRTMRLRYNLDAQPGPWAPGPGPRRLANGGPPPAPRRRSPTRSYTSPGSYRRHRRRAHSMGLGAGAAGSSGGRDRRRRRMAAKRAARSGAGRSSSGGPSAAC